MEPRLESSSSLSISAVALYLPLSSTVTSSSIMLQSLPEECDGAYDITDGDCGGYADITKPPRAVVW